MQPAFGSFLLCHEWISVSLFLCMHVSCWRDLVNWAGTYCNHMLEVVLRFSWNHFGYRIIEQDLFCKGASPKAASWIRWCWFSIGIFLPASRGSFLRGWLKGLGLPEAGLACPQSISSASVRWLHRVWNDRGCEVLKGLCLAMHQVSGREHLQLTCSCLAR